MLCSLAQYYDLVQKTASAQKNYQKALVIYDKSIKEYLDSISYLTNKYFIISLMKDDNTEIANFVRNYRMKYPDNVFLKNLRRLLYFI